MSERLPHFGVKSPTCPHCGTTINVHQKISPGHCGMPVCAHLHASDAGKTIEKRRAKEKAARFARVLAAQEDAMAQAADALHTPRAELIAFEVPYQTSRAFPPPDEVRLAFLDHLHETVPEAYASLADAPLERPDRETGDAPTKLPLAFETAACRACEGKCCAQGRTDHAFIGKGMLRAIFADNPELTVEDVIAHYTDALPERSVDGSCVYHSETGCALARGWRSHVCNSFKCQSLYDLAKKIRDVDEPALALVALASEADVSQVVAHRDGVGTVVIGTSVEPVEI